MIAVIDTDRLQLRPLTADAAGEPYLHWMNDFEVTRFLESRFRRFSEEDLKKYIVDMERKPDALFLGMFIRDGDRHIGNIKLDRVPAHLRGEIGLVVGDRTQWGKGFATEAIRGLTDFALRELRLHKVTAGCYSNNLGSQRAFEKAGFSVEGTRAEHYRFEDQWIDLVMMAKFAGRSD